MNEKKLAKEKVTAAVLEFLSRDLLQADRQKLPDDLQEIFDIVLTTEAGNCICLRQKMIQIKHAAVQWVKVLQPFSELDLDNAAEFNKN